MARARGEELGATPVSPATGAALRMLAGATGAKSVIEVGTGAGVSTLWTLAGMPTEGVLTTIDSEAQIHQIARELLSRSGVPLTRVRMITGRALQVLPRMSRGVYDMAIIDADPQETQAYVDLLLEALRPGGVLVVPHALWRDSVADPARREPDTVALREVLRAIRESDAWTENLLTCGDGLLVAIKNR
ncbi:O-methyltransferase [Mobiluncus mulieris]|uniref:O-methyltransferase n=1 Tax=Mobiluncus mulieris TaxID=2052 RepID=A0A7Y0UUU4_9ACTO|nr:O-methyltransferase [Mobiluncus mulieris]MCU9969114.1 O-methyltransferase [Mobiluncus mulieris]NMW64881.1 O-methyltransferase [Mobiluncus mulieris]NMX03864.1 O-methyltransferase [Mobiluncus mulieris]NMX12034.1 O-methyltransferase [Mobiluncus mulieris]